MSFHPSSSSSCMANRNPIVTVLLQKPILVVWLVTWAVFSEAMIVSKEEYLELKRHLKFLNKPAVKSIKIDYGDIFDCVDINKQLSFDHPALKNHTIQMKPSSLPRRNGNDNFLAPVLDIGLPGEGCPKGTVPIRRVKMQELMRAHSLSDFGKKYIQNGSKPIVADYDPSSHHHWAEDNTEDGTFYGTKVAINLWEPIVPNNSEFSLAQFWLTSGPYEHLNSIEAGWSVYPRLFLDNHVRLFALWTADGYRSGCFNLNCPGFVQVSEKVPLGKRLTPASAYGGEQYEIRLLAFLDPVSKNWWLVYGDEILGYWPHTLFNSLSTKADRVQWGGEVFNPNEGIDQDMPPMCSGHFPEEGYGKACFMRKMQIVKEGNILVDAPKTSTYADVSSCYNAIDKGRLDDWGRTFFFGGPGGKCIK
ncbi:protein neprosin-like isoform X1 [Aristolochia californica]|uniref:protein neprosin-like isoform X1 n=1 Tax=Aristolochia californica TaxID=171875 RepID=UPI0035E1D364